MTQKLTILFDLDGTLVNTAPDLMAAHNHVMKKFGYQQKNLGDIKHIAGKGAWIMMQRSFKEEIKDEKLKKEMVREFLDYYAKNIDKNSTPINGVTSFLKLEIVFIKNSLYIRFIMVISHKIFLYNTN